LHLVLHLKLWSVQLFLPFIPCHQRDRVDIFVFLFWIRSVWRVSMNGRKNYYWPRLLVKDHLQSLFRVCFVHLCSLDIEIFNLKACFAEKEKKNFQEFVELGVWLITKLWIYFFEKTRIC
jgi:hypothetical protein